MANKKRKQNLKRTDGHINKRVFACFMAAVMVCTMTALPGCSSTEDAGTDGTASESDVAELTLEESSSINTSILLSGSREKVYSSYISKYTDAAKPDEKIEIAAKDYVSVAKDATNQSNPELATGTFEGVDDCINWSNNDGDVNYSFDVKKAGLYNLEMLYFPVGGSTTTVELGLLLDGEYPFTAANDIVLDRYWADETAKKTDSKDNEIRPKQIEYDCWITYPIKDKEGLFNNPYYFYLSEGTHTLTLRGIKVNTIFKSFTFKNYDALAKYTAPSQSDLDATPALTGTNAINTSTLFYQGETSLWKSAATLNATYDRTSCMTNPAHATKQRYNTVGLDTWNKATQTITWEVTVPNDGYYKIGVKARQKKNRGFFSNRRIYIDGEVPFDAFDCQQFQYDNNWYMKTLSDENGDAAWIYLTAGTHTLSMEAIPGSIGEVMQRLDNLVYTLNYYYRRILMITGPSPDEYTDYFVDRQIPELIPAFESAIEQLYAEKDNIESLTARGSAASTLEATAIILQRCCDERDKIPSMKDTIKDSISALSAWMRDYRDQPLEVDYIEVATVHENFSSATGNFFEEFFFSFSSFIGSFFEDYTVMSDTSSKSLNVWVSLGRDQATVVKQMVDSDFNVNSGGTEASINLVQGAILEATLAGKGPEIALFIGGDFPIQLAARGLLVDLKQFKDYSDITTRFTDNIMTLYTYNDGVYGLPVSQTFPMMFYRTDILDELGLEPPETWDDFIATIPVLQRKYLEVGLLSPASNLSSSVFESGDTFAMLMLQTGQNIYNKELTATSFDTQASAQVFELWTKFYTTYSFSQTYDAFSRFRTGEMPIVIQNYTFFNQLSVAAPEIKGLWNFTQVPGTVQDDGTVSHAVNSSSAGAIIFTKVSDKQAAWQFVKWFTSTDVMVEYGRSIEGLAGQMSRFDTSNTEALAQLPWSSSEYVKIAKAMSETVEIPIIPASYATTRHVKNAFRAVVNDYWGARYALSSYNRDINAEIVRKNSELQSFENEG